MSSYINNSLLYGGGFTTTGLISFTRPTSDTLIPVSFHTSLFPYWNTCVLIDSDFVSDKGRLCDGWRGLCVRPGLAMWRLTGTLCQTKADNLTADWDFLSDKSWLCDGWLGLYVRLGLTMLWLTGTLCQTRADYVTDNCDFVSDQGWQCDCWLGLYARPGLTMWWLTGTFSQTWADNVLVDRDFVSDLGWQCAGWQGLCDNYSNARERLLLIQ